MTRNTATIERFTTHDNWRRTGVSVGAVCLSGTLLACALGGGTSQERESARPSGEPSAPVTAPANSRSALVLPATWPGRVTLPMPDCRNGAAITRQRPHDLAGVPALYVDGQCNFDATSKPSDPVGLYHTPEFAPPGQAPYRADNGETAIVDCIVPGGQKTGDNRGVTSYRTEWARVAVNNESTGGQPAFAYVSVVNLGQAAVGGIRHC